MNVGEICSREVIVMDRGESLHQAVALMRENHVGDVVITGSRAGKAVPLGSLGVSDVMSSDLLTVTETQTEAEALAAMRHKGVRRAPVVDAGGALVGIVSVDDVIEVLSEQLGNIAALIGREQQQERERRAV